MRHGRVPSLVANGLCGSSLDLAGARYSNSILPGSGALDYFSTIFHHITCSFEFVDFRISLLGVIDIHIPFNIFIV